VSTICYGTWQFGGDWGSVEAREAQAAIRQALALGITFFSGRVKKQHTHPSGGISSMTRNFWVGKRKREERLAIVQEVQQQAKAAARAAVKALLEVLLEVEVTAKLGREKGEVRRVSSQPGEIDWQCGHCGSRDAHQMLRDGHSRRSLQTSWGPLEDLAVPMLECQCCGHDVLCPFAVFDKMSTSGSTWIRMCSWAVA
jgi:Aldo/keto reductase family